MDPSRVLFEKEPDGRFVFTVETQEEARKIAHEVGKAILAKKADGDIQEEAIDLTTQELQNLGEPIGDYRLDGNQLSYSESHDSASNSWTVSIFQRYGDADDIQQLEKVLAVLGFK